MDMNRDDGIVPSTGAGGVREAAPPVGASTGGTAAANAAAAVGERLAAARLAKGRSIDEMASRLKVGTSKIEALERGNLGALHDAAFSVGLTRSYAKVLGIDPGPLADALRGVQTPTTDLSSLPQSSGKPASMRRANVPLSWSTRRSDRRSWLWGGTAAFVVLVLLVVWRAGNEPNGWLQKVRGDAKADIATANPNSGGQVDVGGTSTPASGAVMSSLPSIVGSSSGSGEVTTGGGDAGAASGAMANVTAAMAAPSNALAAAASDTGSAAAATLAAVSSPSAGAAPQAAASEVVVPAGAIPVTMTATQDSWVSVVQADGHMVFSGIVHAGQTQQMEGVRPMRVTIGNISGMSAVTQDGQPVDLTPYAKSGRNVARFTLR
ncbi:helix-turn-helix domain-containing protein [Robbsia andropogonis]|uniref:helix-turn-helix domain-containing protein n=1 Tax=Robbsia andropogonis TaxID=28092 RepID=UPI003D1E3AA4